MVSIYGLTTQNRVLAIGIDEKYPVFAWKYNADEPSVYQNWVRLVVKDSHGTPVWDSGILNTEIMQLRYAGQELKPAQTYTWTITASLSNGTQVSAAAEFQTGVMDSGILENAKWIALQQVDECNCVSIPAFRKEVYIGKSVASAKLFITGCGVYVAYLNGCRIYNRAVDGSKQEYELKPGFTEQLVRKLYHSYDITDQLREGSNCFSAIVSTGWWADRIVQTKGGIPALKAAIRITYTDNSVETVITDETWKATGEQPVRAASIYEGETYDARYTTAFMTVGFDDSNWYAAVPYNGFTGNVSAHIGEPVVCRKDLTRCAVKVYTYSGVTGSAEGKYGKIACVSEYKDAAFVLRKGQTAVIDFGQNFAGREYFRLCGKPGATVTIDHGEMLNDNNGLLSRGNDGPEGSVYTANMRSARPLTRYTIGSDGEEAFRPLHTFYGFRYLSVKADDDVKFIEILGEVLTNVSYDSGQLTCSDPYINQLISNGRWGMYSNYLSVPTDCPQRDERLGWTADTQVFATSAQYYSTAAQSFLEKWSQDLRDCQKEDGSYTSVAPLGPFGADSGALGWADAGILMPYYVWRMSGDTRIIRKHYSSMQRYIDDYLASRGNAGPRPRYGDWLAFEPNDEQLQVYLGVCYYAWDALLMSQMADAIGEIEDSARYRNIYCLQKSYFISAYVNDDGTVKLPHQTAALFALKLDLLPNETSVEAVKQQLVSNIAAHGNCLQTGFLGTAILLPTLSECSLNEMAYTLLLQDQMPSWLYSVKAGATTIWERWNSYSLESGFGDVNMNSFNHYAYGCVSEWLFSYMAGIRPETQGFSRFLIAPVPDKRINYAEAEYESNFGKICSGWRYDGNTLICDCSVPANTRAIFVSPVDGAIRELASGKYSFKFDI